ncbi:nitrate ABC transporter ATP-binding protein [Spirochaetia bacterium]|nr:nitrate ABC transporter ATP-binding protein [Spirochaetia bacterium]
MEKVILRCRELSKSYKTPSGEKCIIDGINLDVKENEFVVLFGPGQCGKTTMINLLSGLEPPSSGTVELNGQLVTGPGPDKGVIYQTIALFPWLTTMQNVEYGPKVRGMPKKQRRERAQHFIDLVGLQGFEHVYPIKLSGGMKQRVGIARVYCNDPFILFMDEPFGALDAQTRYMMQEELGRISRQEKRTVVFVTNNIEEALYLADRIIVMENCPSKIKEEYVIPLPHPRDYMDPEFLRLRKEISASHG